MDLTHKIIIIQAFLAGGRPGKLERRVGPEGFELHHTGGGEHQCRVSNRNNPGAGPD